MADDQERTAQLEENSHPDEEATLHANPALTSDSYEEEQDGSPQRQGAEAGSEDSFNQAEPWDEGEGKDKDKDNDKDKDKENDSEKGSGNRLEIPVSLPMKVSCRADLDPILEDHKGWLESVLNPTKKISGGRANLKGNDLSGFDLTGVNLSGATLEHAKLVGANLTKANLTAANLSHADLQGAMLKNTKLKRAILDYADFRDADMVDVDMTKAHLNHTQLPKAEAAVKIDAEDISSDSEEQNTQL